MMSSIPCPGGANCSGGGCICNGSAAGDTLQLSIGGKTVLWKVAASGTWDDYKAEEIGVVELAAGPAEAAAEVGGCDD